MRPRLVLPATFLALVLSARAAEPPAPRFRAVDLDTQVQIGYGVAIADVDGDKLPDVLLADKKQFRWYRNPGPERAADPAAWSRHLLAENLTPKDNVCIAAQDIDGDGKCEIAVGAEWNPGDTVNSGAVFYLIPPKDDRTQPWQAQRLYSLPTVHRMRWITTAPRRPDAGTDWAIAVLPLHGKGNKNGEGDSVRLLLHYPPARFNDPASGWVFEEVDTGLHMTHNFQVLGKGASKGMLIGGKEGLIHLYRHDGEWQRKVWIGAGAPTQSNGIGEVRVGEISLNVGVLATVEPMHGHQLVAYLGGNPVPATRRVLSDGLADGHALACGDLLGTGHQQIVIGWRGNAQKPRPVGIRLWTPLDPQGEKWRDDPIDDNTMACEDLVLADLNGDGRLDLIASGRSTHNLKLYLNETPKP